MKKDKRSKAKKASSKVGKTKSSSKSSMKEPARRSLAEELAKVATPQAAKQVEATQLDSETECHHDRDSKGMVGIVAWSKGNWQPELRKVMVGEDWQKCLVDAQGWLLYFANSNCILNHVPAKSQFPLRVLRTSDKVISFAVKESYADYQKRKGGAAEKREEQRETTNSGEVQNLYQQKAEEEEKRLALEKAALEEAKKEEERKKEEEKRLALEKAALEEAKKEEERKKEEEKRLALEKAALEEAKKEEERKKEEEKRLALEKAALEEAKKEEERKKEEEKRLALEKAALEEAKREEERKKEEERRLALEKAALEEAKKEEERRKEEEKRLTLENKVAEETKRVEEAKRLEEEKRLQAEKAAAEGKLLVEKAEDEKQLLEDLEKQMDQFVDPENKRGVVESNLLRPGTMDLDSAPPTPSLPDEIKNDPKEEKTPGEEAAEADKKRKLEQQKKRHAQWARFMRTFNSSGLITWKFIWKFQVWMTEIEYQTQPSYIDIDIYTSLSQLRQCQKNTWWNQSFGGKSHRQKPEDRHHCFPKYIAMTCHACIYIDMYICVSCLPRRYGSSAWTLWVLDLRWGGLA